jgi:AraC family transcriptional activator of mar-sox-rob regulon
MLWSMTAKVEETTPWHRHDILEWVFCRSGAGRLETDGQDVDLRPGRAVFIAPNARHRFAFDAEEKADLKFLCLNSADLAAHLAPAQLALLERVKTAQISYADHEGSLLDVQDLCGLIPDGFNITDARDLTVAWGAVGMLVALHVQSDDAPEDHNLLRYREKIDEIKGWIDAKLDECLSLDEVSAQFGLSRSVLTREFRRHTGKSLIDYCNGRRVEKAAAILAAGKQSVTQAALESGFTNLSHFYRQFKATYGLTPKAFRRQLLGVPDF